MQPSAPPADDALQPVVVVAAAPDEEVVPADEKQFSYDDAVALLKGSKASHVAGYTSLLVSIVTLVVNLNLVGNLDDGGSEVGATCSEESVAQLTYVACAAAFATGQVVPLAKTTRDRFVASMHAMPSAPQGLNLIKPTTEAYAMAAIFFVASTVFCIHAIVGLADTTDEAIGLILNFFFLVCSSAWVCKSTRDRSDVANDVWKKDADGTRLILRLARGTGSNVILCVVAWLSSIILTIVCIWKSGVEEFDSTLKLLLTMGEFFQTIMALYLAKTVRDSDIARRVAHTDWMMAIGGGTLALGFTYAALFINWSKIGDALGVTLWTGLAFSLFSTFFFAKMVRDHKELQKRGWEVSIWKTICSPANFDQGQQQLGRP